MSEEGDTESIVSLFRGKKCRDDKIDITKVQAAENV